MARDVPRIHQNSPGRSSLVSSDCFELSFGDPRAIKVPFLIVQVPLSSDGPELSLKEVR